MQRKPALLFPSTLPRTAQSSQQNKQQAIKPTNKFGSCRILHQVSSTAAQLVQRRDRRHGLPLQGYSLLSGKNILHFMLHARWRVLMLRVLYKVNHTDDTDTTQAHSCRSVATACCRQPTPSTAAHQLQAQCLALRGAIAALPPIHTASTCMPPFAMHTLVRYRVAQCLQAHSPIVCASSCTTSIHYHASGCAPSIHQRMHVEPCMPALHILVCQRAVRSKDGVLHPGEQHTRTPHTCIPCPGNLSFRTVLVDALHPRDQRVHVLKCAHVAQRHADGAQRLLHPLHRDLTLVPQLQLGALQQ